LKTNIVDVYIGYLRQKLGNYAIETVRGIGYRLHTVGNAYKRFIGVASLRDVL
jgi:Transcriptional regulatory protein, C terminal